MRPAERPAMAEGCGIPPCPQTTPVRHHDQHLAARLEHPPYVTQCFCQALGELKAMHHQHQIYAPVRERQVRLIDKAGQIGGVSRPARNPLTRRHETEHRGRSSRQPPR